MSNPVKLNIVKSLRKLIDTPLMAMKLPNVDPDLISVLSVLLVVVAIMHHSNLWWVFGWVMASLIFDWMDGVIARKHNRATKRGYIVDVYCDRLSEGILFTVFFVPWFYLFILNMILTVIGFKTKVHFNLALRLIFLVVLVLQLAGLNWGFIIP
ncbi:CDP-alcohol phosphatidyltransferase family protein [Candidatus Woesearchaeota archaeon]|nr:CDP-alcohol phosphatidyltransferase family protein [Candidatus Woesearchaeota archaeon]